MWVGFRRFCGRIFPLLYLRWERTGITCDSFRLRLRCVLMKRIGFRTRFFEKCAASLGQLDAATDTVEQRHAMPRLERRNGP